MKDYLTIPIQKEEIAKIFTVCVFVLPTIPFIVTLDSYMLLWLMMSAFGLIPLFMFKEEYDWDFHIKIKFYESKSMDDRHRGRFSRHG